MPETPEQLHAPDSDYVWSDERWRLQAMPPTGLPLVLVLEPREHFDGPADLPEELAREQGRAVGRGAAADAA